MSFAIENPIKISTAGEPPIISHKKIKSKNIDAYTKGIILSGGPLNVYEIRKYSFDKNIIETDIGEFEVFEGELVPLDLPQFTYINEEEKVELNKPKKGGPKKYYVYVKDPKTDKVKKITWGDTTGLKVKLGNEKARKSFAARHKCESANDKTTARYWACRLPHYAKQLGLSDGGNFFW